MLSIGQAARRTGIRVGTIRYYETAGILPKARRGENGRRVYDESDIEHLEFIRRARQLDFNIRTVRALIDLQNAQHTSCAEASRLAAVRMAEIEGQIARLTAQYCAIGEMVACCGNHTVANCQVIAALNENSAGLRSKVGSDQGSKLRKRAELGR